MARRKRTVGRKAARPAAPPPPSAAVEPPAAPPPAHRRLKVFSLDPAADVQLENSLISRSVLPVTWETVRPGPAGEYVEVVDVDPSSGCVYDPVDLNDPDLLAQDGLSPSTGNPQFHQQMAYAVAMKTIANFEGVLGRKILWAERRYDENLGTIKEPALRYVQRLRIYPHALRDENAYYSPSKAALLFGYFNASTTDPRDELPGGVVFTCLSHDIVAHETTHAILDGMHRRMLDASNVDMIAFHEAFADIVAIFQHFTLPGLLLDQIQRTRGNLQSNSLLARLAAQFARATGQGDALRNALGTFDADGRREAPDPADLGRTFEPHERGAILVAAVFDAFVRMYENRTADLRRIASGGTGVLPEGDIHPDLARRFAEEAVRLSQRVLDMCIRAIDYLPPVDVTFGDFLRAVVTADADFYPDDANRYRLAFIEAFRDRGIFPLDVRALAEDALRWKPLDANVRPLIHDILPPPAVLRTMAAAYDSTQMAALLGNADENADPALIQGEIWDDFRAKNFDRAVERFLNAAWQQETASTEVAKSQYGERFPRYVMERMFARFLNGWIQHKARARPFSAAENQRIAWTLGIDLEGLTTAARSERMRLEVHAVRPTVRLRADGRSKVELLIILGQRTRVGLLADPSDQTSTVKGPDRTPLSFWFRGGATLIVDPEAGAVTYSVAKNIRSRGRQGRQMAFLRNQLAREGSAAITRFGLTDDAATRQRKLEPFALAHAAYSDAGTY
jgi:hypothetical protein